MHLAVFLFASLVVAHAQTEDEETHILNGKQKKKYWDCLDLRVTGGYKESGLFYIYPNTTTPMKVFCRFELNNTFTSIMGQKDGSVGFKRPYNDYVNGFGSSSTNNFWLGLASMKHLTDIGHVNMRITLQDWNHVIKEIYYKFSLGPTYYAYFSNYQGTLPDDFFYNSGMPFETYDRYTVGCARATLAGWWYNTIHSTTACTYTLPTGHYYPNGHYYPKPTPDGIFYKDWLGNYYSLKYIRIDLAPNP